MLYDFIQHFPGRVALNHDFHPNRLKPHLGRFLQSTARTPGRRVANIAFHENLQLAQLDLLPRGHSGDAHRQATTQARQHDLPRCRCGVFAKQVQWLINHHRLVFTDIAERAVHALHHGFNLVGAA